MQGEDTLLSVPKTRSSLGSVIACINSAQHRARLIDALRNHATVTFTPSLDDLSLLLRASVDTVDVVILPAVDGDHKSSERLVRQIALERPRTALVVWCPPEVQHVADLRAFAAAGVHQFLFGGMHEGGSMLRDVIAAARRGCAAEQVMSSLRSLVPPSLHPMVEVILTHPGEVTSIRAIADALGVDRKTVFNWCEKAKFLPPGELLVWCRLALVAYHLENTGCTIETIALELSYPSDSTLRNTMKRHTGMRASQVRTGGGIAPVMAAFQRRLSA